MKKELSHDNEPVVFAGMTQAELDLFARKFKQDLDRMREVWERCREVPRKKMKRRHWYNFLFWK